MSKKTSKNKSYLNLWLALIGIVVVIASFSLAYFYGGSKGKEKSDPPKITSGTEIKKVSKNIEDFVNDLKTYSADLPRYGMYSNETDAKADEPTGMGNAGDAEYSQTNNQVEGVDEGDFVKTDGQYIYVAKSGGYRYNEIQEKNKISIIKINKETGELEKVNEIEIDKNIDYIQYLHLYENKLAVVGQQYSYSFEPYYEETGVKISTPQEYQKDCARILIYDISEPKNPALMEDYRADGYIQQSRFVDGSLYLINNDYNNQYFYNDIFPVLEKDISDGEKTTQINKILEKNLPFSGKTEEVDSQKRSVDSLSYITPIHSYDMINITSLNLKNDDFKLDQEIIMGYTYTIYASKDNLYLTNTEYPWFYSPMREEDTEYTQKTNIFRFSMDNGNVEFEAKGAVEGTILNQFSLDEYDNHLRIATTTNQGFFGPFFAADDMVVSRAESSSETIAEDEEGKVYRTNNLYILDENLEISGKIEDLADNEQIYSVRFMGDKGYIVTFKTTDPLFTFDLSDPKNPKLLGELKIPGYSNYLHPINETTLLGIGKEAVESEENKDFAWYQGMKIGLFDVSDMSNPKEIDSMEIGDRGTDSEALWDHKAFLWDSRNSLLALPIELRIIPEDQKVLDGEEKYWTYGEFEYQGTYLFDINNSIVLRGRVTHIDDYEKVDPDYYYQEYNKHIRRQMYVGDWLITISNEIVQSNNLETLNYINQVEL